MLSFQEFKNQVLSIFDVTEKECKFANNCTYLGVTISYKPWIVFEIKYIKNDGRWYIQKTYTQKYEVFSDSLAQSIETIGKQTTDNINEELQIFYKIQKGWKNAKFQELFEFFDKLTKTKK